jgi:hypothetical protein
VIVDALSQPRGRAGASPRSVGVSPMAATMRRARLLCLRHNGQFVRGTELSEHPEHTL